MTPTLWIRPSVLLALGISVLAACGGTRGDASARGAMTGFRGVSPATPYQKPDFTFTDFNGKPYNFRQETNGKVALLFFGYTHCPDICPLHMANIAAALRSMPAGERDAIRVVFVTTDPERDTPERLKTWLGAFDPTFVGLAGPQDQVDQTQKSLGMVAAYKEYAAGADSAEYFVGHGAQVFAFARDGMGYLIYPSGIRQEDWKHDLPKLARDTTGAETRKELAAIEAQQAQSGAASPAPMNGLQVSIAVIAQPVTQDEAALYFVLQNGTPMNDVLVGVSTDVAASVMLHDSFPSGRMAMIDSVPLGPNTEVRFEPGGRHAMLAGLRRKLVAGDTVRIGLMLRKAGTIELIVPVLPYEQVQQVIGTATGKL